MIGDQNIEIASMDYQNLDVPSKRLVLIRCERQRQYPTYMVTFDQKGLVSLRLTLDKQADRIDEGKEESFPQLEFLLDGKDIVPMQSYSLDGQEKQEKRQGIFPGSMIRPLNLQREQGLHNIYVYTGNLDDPMHFISQNKQKNLQSARVYID